MTTSLQIKITINEFVTPDLFRAVSAVPNPRQRASLLKRLAQDALRNSVPTSHPAPAATSVTAGTSVMPQAIRSGTEPSSSSIKPGCLFSETGVLDEDRRQFGCTSDVSSAAGAPQTLQPIEGTRHNLVTAPPHSVKPTRLSHQSPLSARRARRIRQKDQRCLRNLSNSMRRPMRTLLPDRAAGVGF